MVYPNLNYKQWNCCVGKYSRKYIN